MSVRQQSGGVLACIAGACLALAGGGAAAKPPAGEAAIFNLAAMSDNEFQAKLAASPGAGLRNHATPHFVLMHTHDEAWAASMSGFLERLYDNFARASASAGFAVCKPKTPLMWLCFCDAAAFEKYNSDFEGRGRPAFKSFYSSRTDRVLLLEAAPTAAILDDDATRIAHEMAHQLSFNCGLQTRGVMYPLWVSEGLAMLFESALLSPDLFAADNPARREQLRIASEHHRLKPLKEFVLMTQAPVDTEARIDFYAQAWGLANMMLREHREAFARYLAILAQMDGGRRPDAALAREFQSAFGDPSTLESRWQSHLALLNSPQRGKAPAVSAALPHTPAPRG